MFFDEIFRPNDGTPLLSEDQMRQARINRWGTDTPTEDTKGKPLPGTGYEPSWFEGIGDSWLGLNAALAETKSSALTVLSDLPIGTEEEREGWLRAAEATRAYSKAHYEADPEIMGSASQIIHGLFRSIPKAAGYSAALGPGAGALAFGADIGINESQKLKDEGVDQNTRTWAGVTSFAANALGLRLPAAIGSTRLQSTLYGGLANVGTDSAERKGIQFILEQQDYKELAKQYDLSSTDMIVSGAFGAFFGAAAWRRPPTKLELDTQERREALRRDLKATGVYTDEQANVQAGVHAKGEVLFARDAGVDWKDVAYTVEKGDARSASGAFHMPLTQGIEWHMGPSAKKADDPVRVVVSENGAALDRDSAIDTVLQVSRDGVLNRDSGFVLTASKSDLKKSVGGKRSYDEIVFRRIANDFSSIVENAVRLESFNDVAHKNPHVQGVHIFATPVAIDDKLFRVQLLVRDYVTPKQERASVHKISGIQIFEIENPPKIADGGVSDIRGVTAPAIRLAGKPVASSDHIVSLSDLVGGRVPYVRQDGLSLFDSVSSSSRQIGGMYYDASSANGVFNQIIGEKGVGNLSYDAYVNLGTAEQLASEGVTPEQIRLATGWERGADGKWRYEIPDMTFREDAFSDLEALDRDADKRFDELLESAANDDEFASAQNAAEEKRKNAVVSKELGRVVDAPELFAAYPELRYMRVEFGPLADSVGGYYDPEGKVIRLPNKVPSKAMKEDRDRLQVLVHEVQHAIQDIEGFTSGANPKLFPTMGEALADDMSRLFELKKSENYQKYKQAADALAKATPEDFDRAFSEFEEARSLPSIDEIIAEQDRLREKWGMDQTVISAINNASDQFDPVFRIIHDENRHYQTQQYLRVAGEVEARNASRRLDLSADERRTKTLESTESIPRSEQITRKGKLVRSESRNGVFYQAAYHGTAYTFDKFTLDHVGSGEGVQAHGWGLYFSLDRHIAEGYRSRVTSYRGVADELSRVFAGMDVTTREGMAKALSSASDKLSPATRKLLDALLEANWLGHENPMDAVQASLVAQIGKGNQTPRIKSAVEGLRNEEGNVYKVEIPDDDVMMHEDRPLSEQPEPVQMAVRALLTDEDVRTQPETNRERNGIEDVEPVSYAGKSLDEMTGKEILAALIAKFGSAKAASLALKQHGLKGYRYKGAIDGECAVVFDDAAIEMRNAIEKAVEDGNGVVHMPDGTFEVRGMYEPAARKITLTPKADISTFAHEHSHWYLDMLMRVLDNGKIDTELLADAMALLKSWGINSIEEWRALGVEGQRKYQEQFAAQTEIFLSKGKAPTRDLEGIFERFGKWIVDLYKSLIGADVENPVEASVKDRYKQTTGEDLPPLSKQVETVIKRMYGQQERVRSVKPSRAQVVAARVAQAQRVTEQKTTAPFKNPRGADAYDAAQRATRVAVGQVNDGKPVDVAAEVRGVEMNEVALTDAQKNFARAVQMSDDSSSMVVLQNRDRSAVASIGQMSAIAANPMYSRMSFDRSTGSGAPIVSFGSMPDVRYQGVTDYVMDGGERIPVTYAVVEADSVLTSNAWDGRAIDGYGEDSSRVHAVAGNGRMAGLTEAYNRGTAGQYVEDMIADAQMTGIDPQAIRELKRPALVRFIPSEKVTTGFIDRSNQSQVLEMSGKERAVQDAGKLSARRLQEYTFDENGDPTRDTLNRFVTDIGEPSALGNLIDSAGNPTEAAKTRIKAALFYAAYRDPELTSLVAVETDKQGIKRILNAMAAFAPHVINIRESSNGVIDLGPGIVEAVHMIRRGELPGQADIFGDVSPVSQQIFEIFYTNKNSAAAIGRILGGFSDSIAPGLGEGSGALLGDPLDLADAMGYLRQAQNAEIQRLIDEGKTDLSLMPDIDIEAVRQAIRSGQEAAKSAGELVDAVGEKVARDSGRLEGEIDVKPEEVSKRESDIDPMLEERARAVSIAGKDADMVRLENLAAEKPDQAYTIDDNGTQMTMDEVFAEMRRVEQEAEVDAAGIGKAAECILRNGGIEQ